jgi:hypothetical protein
VDTEAQENTYPFEGWVGPPFPAGVFPIRIDAHPLPLSQMAVERITWLLERGVALRLLSTEQRFIDAFCSAVELLGVTAGGEVGRA